MRKTCLSTQKLSISYHQQQVIDSLDLALPAAKVSVLIGSNGCGKSTLLKAMARLLTPQSGTVILDGADIHTSNTAQIARQLAILPQTPSHRRGHRASTGQPRAFSLPELAATVVSGR
jgi:iron complex transport system ATP-binding protein